MSQFINLLSATVAIFVNLDEEIIFFVWKTQFAFDIFVIAIKAGGGIGSD